MINLDQVKVTPRDQQVLHLLAQGCSNKEIGDQLNISRARKTASSHAVCAFRNPRWTPRVEDSTHCAGNDFAAGSLLLVSVGLMVDGTSRGIWFNGRFDLNPAMLTAWRYLRWVQP